MTVETNSRPTARRYSPELKDRAVRMVLQLRQETGTRNGTVKRVADQLDIGPESLRLWVRQAEIDGGQRPGTSSEDEARIKALEQENRELRRANDILKAAASFFGAELDRQSKR